MQSRILTFSLFVSLVLALSSCGSMKFNVGTDVKERTPINFIITSNGDTITGSRLRAEYKHFDRALNDNYGWSNSEFKDVSVLQNDKGYYRKINGQLCPRLVKGLINVYVYTKVDTKWETIGTSSTGKGNHTYSTKVRYERLMFQKGANGPIIDYSMENLRNLMKDHPPSIYILDSMVKEKNERKKWNWINTGAVIGGFVALGAFGSTPGTDDISAMGYAGGTLIMGGLVSGFINKSKKQKIDNMIVAAIDEYNAHAMTK